MSRELPAQPNLEYLKKEAKELLDARRPRHSEWKLADAQHALAREYGFESWPKLRAHVDSVVPEPSPLVGRWVSDIAKSKRHPENLFRRATLEIAVAGNVVTISHDGVDELGRVDRGVNTIHADGVERVHDHGIRLTAQWASPRRLDLMTTHAGLPARGATYEVSPDGRSLTVSTADQRILFDRV
jgi:hypothetical protein